MNALHRQARSRNRRIHRLCRALQVRKRSGKRLDRSLSLIRSSDYIPADGLRAMQTQIDTGLDAWFDALYKCINVSAVYGSIHPVTITATANLVFGAQGVEP